MLYSGTGATLSAGAYGIILLTSQYTGPCIQIKNGSSGTPTDFYPALDGSTTLKTASGTTLTSFLAGTIAYVTKWYDQTGNGKHATAQGSPLPFLNTTTFVVDFGSVGYFSLSDGSFPTGNLPYTYLYKQGNLPPSNTYNMSYSGGSSGTANMVTLIIHNSTVGDAWYSRDSGGVIIQANSVVAATYGGGGNNNGATGKLLYLDNINKPLTYYNSSGDRNQTSSNCYLGSSHLVGPGSYSTYQSTMPYFYWLPYQLGSSDRIILGST